MKLSGVDSSLELDIGITAQPAKNRFHRLRLGDIEDPLVAQKTLAYKGNHHPLQIIVGIVDETGMVSRLHILQLAQEVFAVASVCCTHRTGPFLSTFIPRTTSYGSNEDRFKNTCDFLRRRVYDLRGICAI